MEGTEPQLAHGKAVFPARVPMLVNGKQCRMAAGLPRRAEMQERRQPTHLQPQHKVARGVGCLLYRDVSLARGHRGHTKQLAAENRRGVRHVVNSAHCHAGIAESKVHALHRSFQASRCAALSLLIPGKRHQHVCPLASGAFQADLQPQHDAGTAKQANKSMSSSSGTLLTSACLPGGPPVPAPGPTLGSGR